MKRDLNKEVLDKIEEDKWTPADIIFHLLKFMLMDIKDDEKIMKPFITLL